jgi:hypothetical protein
MDITNTVDSHRVPFTDHFIIKEGEEYIVFKVDEEGEYEIITPRIDGSIEIRDNENRQYIKPKLKYAEISLGNRGIVTKYGFGRNLVNYKYMDIGLVTEDSENIEYEIGIVENFCIDNPYGMKLNMNEKYMVFDSKTGEIIEPVKLHYVGTDKGDDKRYVNDVVYSFEIVYGNKICYGNSTLVEMINTAVELSKFEMTMNDLKRKKEADMCDKFYYLKYKK